MMKHQLKLQTIYQILISQLTNNNNFLSMKEFLRAISSILKGVLLMVLMNLIIQKAKNNMKIKNKIKKRITMEI
jgi:hypothetical protein